MLKLAKPVYHAFVYLQVKGRYYLKLEDLHISLDKHTDALTIQVSTGKRDVFDNFKGNPRNGVPEEFNAEKGKINIRELTNFYYPKEVINEGYNAWKGIHCKQFAKDIFDEVAAVSRYYWEGDERKLKLKALLSFVGASAVAVIGVATGGAAVAAGAIAAAAGSAATAGAVAAATASEASAVVGGAAGAAVVAVAATASEASGAAACAAGAGSRKHCNGSG